MKRTRQDSEESLETVTWSATRDLLGGRALNVPGLTILHHPQPERIGEVAPLLGLEREGMARLSRKEPLFAPPGQSPARPLGDPRLSRSDIQITEGPNGVLRLRSSNPRARLAIGMGEEIEEIEVAPSLLEVGMPLMLGQRVVLLLHRLPPRPTEVHPAFELVGESGAMLQLRREILRVADLEIPVLLRGESGTGKDLVARAIGAASRRSRKPFLAVNIGAIPPSLAASELFGAARGAFSGADRRRLGYVQRAAGGTLFLDEIGEASPEVQVLLLRLLENAEVQPVGGDAPSSVDIRVIAATDANLEAAIAAGTFRSPLLHRLSSYEIFLPPLRERLDDLGRIFLHFLRQELAAVGEEWRLTVTDPRGTSWVPAPLILRLAGCRWPGNVRQLKNIVRQLVVGSRGRPELRIGSAVRRLLADAAPPKIHPGSVPVAENLEAVETAPRKYRDPAEITHRELLEGLRRNRWEIKATALDLGVSRTSLYSLIDRHPGVRKASDLRPFEIEQAQRGTDGSLDAMVEMLEVSKAALKRRIRELVLKNPGNV